MEDKYSILKKVFGYDRFRPGQAEIVDAALAGRDVLAVMPTGAGKSTLMSLLTRFYDPTEGSIELDGVDLRDYRLADLRSQFAIVLQEPVLFSTSIAENICYARHEATPEEIIAAARAAGSSRLRAAWNAPAAAKAGCHVSPAVFAWSSRSPGPKRISPSRLAAIIARTACGPPT